MFLKASQSMNVIPWWMYLGSGIHFLLDEWMRCDEIMNLIFYLWSIRCKGLRVYHGIHCTYYIFWCTVVRYKGDALSIRVVYISFYEFRYYTTTLPLDMIWSSLQRLVSKVSSSSTENLLSYRCCTGCEVCFYGGMLPLTSWTWYPCDSSFQHINWFTSKEFGTKTARSMQDNTQASSKTTTLLPSRFAGYPKMPNLKPL